jgi:hypothetical protein
VSLGLTERRFGLILGRMGTITTKDGTRIYEGMSEFLARRGLLIGGVTAVLAAAAGRLVGAAEKPTITVHKSPT